MLVGAAAGSAAAPTCFRLPLNPALPTADLPVSDVEMSYLLNSPATFADESADGFVAAHADPGPAGHRRRRPAHRDAREARSRW